jgi:hypothetical protein
MIDLSLAGVAGAFIGIVAAAIAYGPLVRTLERWLRASGGADEHDTSELSLLRRALLAVDILLFAGAGYWLAARLVGLS